MNPTKLFDFITKNEIKIPTYQRIYTWKKEQINSFIEDLIFDISKERNINLGVMYVDKKSDKTFEIIDGQQRLTTFYLLSNALIFLNGDLKLTQAKNIIKFNNSRMLGTTINTLNSSYDDFYNFINDDLIKKEPTNVYKHLKSYISKNGFHGNDDQTEDKESVKSELVLGFKAILDFLENESNLHYKNMLIKKSDQNNFDTFKTEFYMIQNPYPTDPISLFERLNNRGVELNFVSLSKIKVHQFVINKNTGETHDELEFAANQFLEGFNSCIYQPFEKHPKSMKADNKDTYVQKALVDYLEVYSGEKIGGDKNKALEQLGIFLENELGSIKKYSSYNLTQTKSLVQKTFEHFQIFLSIQVLFDKKHSETKDLNFKHKYVMTDNVLRNYLILANQKPVDLSSISSHCKLKAVKIEKYNSLMVYVLSLYLQAKINSEETYFKESSDMHNFSNNLVILSVYYWIKFIGNESNYSNLLRDDLDLEELITVIKKNKNKNNKLIIEKIDEKVKSLIENKYENSKPFMKLRKRFIEESEKILKENERSEERWTNSIREKVKNLRDFIL